MNVGVALKVGVAEGMTIVGDTIVGIGVMVKIANITISVNIKPIIDGI